MSSADSYELQARRMEEIPPTVRHRVPLRAVARIAANTRHSGVARALSIAVALGNTHAVVSRMEENGKQVGPRYMVEFDFTAERVRRDLPFADLGEFDRCIDTDNLVKVIDGSPGEAGVPLPWIEPVTARPWWKIW